jgi:hypothetical protein
MKDPGTKIQRPKNQKLRESMTREPVVMDVRFRIL